MGVHSLTNSVFFSIFALSSAGALFSMLQASTLSMFASKCQIRAFGYGLWWRVDDVVERPNFLRRNLFLSFGCQDEHPLAGSMAPQTIFVMSNAANTNHKAAKY